MIQQERELLRPEDEKISCHGTEQTIVPIAVCQAQVVEHDTAALPRIVSRRAVAESLGTSVVTLWRMVRDGRFPKPFRVSPGRVGWCARTVRLWIDKQQREIPGEKG